MSLSSSLKSKLLFGFEADTLPEGPVARWNSVDPAQRYAVQTSGNRQFVRVLDDDLPAIRSDGSNDEMLFSEQIVQPETFHVFAYIKLAASKEFHFMHDSSKVDRQFGAESLILNGQPIIRINEVDLLFDGIPAVDDDLWHAVHWKHKPGDYRITVDGLETVVNPSPLADRTTFSKMFPARRSNDFNGWCRYYYITSQELHDAEIIQFMVHLMNVPAPPITPVDEFSAVLLKVVDGDTVILNIDFSAAPVIPVKCRLKGINAPEVGTRLNPNLDGLLSKAETMQWFRDREDQVLTVQFDARDKYGRSLVVVIDQAGERLNDFLLEKGFAEPYVR